MTRLDYITQIEELVDEALNDLSPEDFDTLLENINELVNSYD